jgi:hypothetical protein
MQIVQRFPKTLAYLFAAFMPKSFATAGLWIKLNTFVCDLGLAL